MSTIQFFIWLFFVLTVLSSLAKWLFLEVYSAEVNVFNPELNHSGTFYFKDNEKYIPGLDPPIK